ncbi:MAG: type II toxin-antitoxin system PemK/MazF family toxin [bacterium]
MKNYSRNEVILIKYPFSSLTDFKVRPAIIISTEHKSDNIIIVPLTSKIINIYSDEFILKDWESTGLNVITAVKRGIFTIDSHLIIKRIGFLSNEDIDRLNKTILEWIGL